MAATVPFQLRAVHATPSFRRLLLDADGTLQGRVNMSAEGVAHGRLLYAYDAILRAHYGMTLDVDYPLIVWRRATPSPASSGTSGSSSTRASSRCGSPSAAAARRDDAGGDPAAGSRPRASCRATAGRRVRVLRVRRRAGDGRHGPGGTLLAQARPDRQGVDRVERPLPGARGQAPDAPPAARRCAWAWPRSRTTACFVLNYDCDMEHGCIFADTDAPPDSRLLGSVYERAVTQGRPVDRRRPRRMTRAGRAYEDSLLAGGVRNIIWSPRCTTRTRSSAR